MKDRQMATDESTLTDELYTPKEVCDIFKISQPTLVRWVANGQFPPPRKIWSSSDNRWTRDDLNKVLATMPVATAYKDCGYQEGQRA